MQVRKTTFYLLLGVFILSGVVRATAQEAQSGSQRLAVKLANAELEAAAMTDKIIALEKQIEVMRGLMAKRDEPKRVPPDVLSPVSPPESLK